MLKNKVWLGLYAVLWKTKYTATANTEINRISSSQVLLINFSEVDVPAKKKRNCKKSQDPQQASCSMLNYKVCHSTIRKSLKITVYGLFGRIAYSLKHMAARVRSARLHLTKPNSWDNVFGTDKTKIEIFGHNAQHHVWPKLISAYQDKHLTPAVKHGVMI